MGKNTSKRKKSELKTSQKLDKLFEQNVGERFGDEKISKMNIGDADLEYSQLFGANKNLYRTTPSLISGLKPGKTRLYYTWWENEGRPQNVKPETLRKLNFYKVSEIASQAVRYHPHGTISMEEMIGRDGQSWNNNVMLIVPQGAYGNQRGDSVASGRYIEAKLSEYLIDCFFNDFDYYCVPMKLAYTGKRYEPEFLPSRYPHVLFNPQFSGIGYGLSSNIPPFNMGEVIDATIKLIKNPSAKIILIPDIPTGCDILDEGNFKEINKTGQSKITLRATSEIDYVNNVITITSLPLNSSSSSVINKIISIKNNKKGFDEIIDIKDYTLEGEVKIEIYLKSDAKAEKVLNQLYKGTGLKSVFPVGISVIDDYQEYEYGVKDLLLEWINYRMDAVRSMFLNKLQIVLAKQHMNEVLLFVFNKDNIDITINIAKTSKSRSETINRFIKTFHITSVQAGVIADMKVHQFNEDSYHKFKEEKEKLKEEIKYIKSILNHDEELEKFIIDQLKEGKQKYATPRKSKIVKETTDDDIPDSEHLIGISETGFIKKLSLKNNTSIGQVGKTNSNLTLMKINNKANLMVVDSKGYVTKISVSSIPNMEYEDIGIELNKFFSVKGDIKAVMEFHSNKILEVKDENLGIIFATKKGFTKKVLLSEFENIVDNKLAITLNKNDEVATAIFSFNDAEKDLLIYTNLGNGLRLKYSDVKVSSCTAKGMKLVTLGENEEVSGLSLMQKNKKYIFVATTSGRGKLLETKYFPVMEKRENPLTLINLNSKEHLMIAHSVSKTDKCKIYRKNGDSAEIDIKSVPVLPRISKGEKIFTAGKGDSIIGYKVFI